MIMIAATLALISAPAPTADPTPLMAAAPRAEIQEDVRQVAKTTCRAEADGPQLALLLACARETSRGGEMPLPVAQRSASAR
jgi:hypothetical protein